MPGYRIASGLAVAMAALFAGQGLALDPRPGRAMLRAGKAAKIEARHHLCVTENPDGTATLSCKIQGFVFVPCAHECGAALGAVAGELDARFAAIAARATR